MKNRKKRISFQRGLTIRSNESIMNHIPWRYLSSWKCIGCGDCCRHYTINISFSEGLKIVKQHGWDKVKPGLNEYYLTKGPDGRCIFQYPLMRSKWLCSLQYMKPKNCRLWPFQIRSEPKYGREKEALYLFKGRKYYIYVDPYCRGITWGKPSAEYIQLILPEFIQLSTTNTRKQSYSTSQSFIPISTPISTYILKTSTS